MLKTMLLPMLLAGIMLPLAGCDEAAPTNASNTAGAATAAPDTLAAGDYEVVAKVIGMRSTDGKTPLITAKPGDSITSRGCVDAKGVPEPKLFAAAGDQCTAENPYFRGGTVNVTLSCTRKGVNGKIMVNVDGSTTAAGFKGDATTTTFIDGPGDYELRTELTGKRVGACPKA